MVPLKLIRQRYLPAEQLHGPPTVEVESQIQQIYPRSQYQQQHTGAFGPSPICSAFYTASSPSSSKTTRRLSSVWRQIAQDVLWIASALFILYYGDFRDDFFSLLVTDPRILRVPLRMGLACLVLDLCAFVYVAMQLNWERHLGKWVDMAASAAEVPAAIALGVATFVLLTMALWPIWYILTIPMLFTLLMAFMVVAAHLLHLISPKLQAGTL